VPLVVHVGLVWLPALASVGLSFTDWNGLGGLDALRFIGLRNYEQLATAYPPFWPAVTHNLVWLGAFLFVATPLGIAIAVLLDRELRGSAFYRSAFFLPVVLSLALVGFIWQLVYAPEEGLLNGLLGTTGQDNLIDWLGNPDLNLWAVLVAASWRHVGYIAVLYLAGLRSVDPSLRDAAAIDGAGEWRTFRDVTFPQMRPINTVVLVVTVIESLRAFDVVYVINRGLNGLELLSVLVTNNMLGEASRVGFGSAIATVLLVVSLGPIGLYLRRVLREAPA
jgi:multiple sugar transport system permease protein